MQPLDFSLSPPLIPFTTSNALNAFTLFNEFNYEIPCNFRFINTTIICSMLKRIIKFFMMKRQQPSPKIPNKVLLSQRHFNNKNEIAGRESDSEKTQNQKENCELRRSPLFGSILLFFLFSTKFCKAEMQFN